MNWLIDWLFRQQNVRAGHWHGWEPKGLSSKYTVGTNKHKTSVNMWIKQVSFVYQKLGITCNPFVTVNKDEGLKHWTHFDIG